MTNQRKNLHDVSYYNAYNVWPPCAVRAVAVHLGIASLSFWDSFGGKDYLPFIRYSIIWLLVVVVEALSNTQVQNLPKDETNMYN